MSLESELATLNAATADLIVKADAMAESSLTLATKADEAADSEAIASTAATNTRNLFNHIYLGV